MNSIHCDAENETLPTIVEWARARGAFTLAEVMDDFEIGKAAARSLLNQHRSYGLEPVSGKGWRAT